MASKSSIKKSSRTRTQSKVHAAFVGIIMLSFTRAALASTAAHHVVAGKLLFYSSFPLQILVDVLLMICNVYIQFTSLAESEAMALLALLAPVFPPDVCMSRTRHMLPLVLQAIQKSMVLDM